jgi:methionine-gamma-lyase
VLGFNPGDKKKDIEDRLKKAGWEDKLAMIYVETPANPTNNLIDINMCAGLAQQYSIADKKVIVAVDNTYMGPLWQHPLKSGADLVLYSATKYIGGHSDVIAGAVLGSANLIGRVKLLRTFLGNMISPHTGWLLLRSLETLKVRMDQQASNAEKVAAFLSQHPLVERVYYLGNIIETDAEQRKIFQQQCLGKGAMLSFDIKGGEAEAFTFLNNLKLIKLAVSLGGTESLAEHPATMTHVDIPEAEKELFNISPKLIRLSIGVENYKDLIWDIKQALSKIEKRKLETA